MSIYHCPNCFQANTCGCYEVHMRECRTPKAVLDASQDRLNAAAVSVKAEGLSLSDRAKKLVKLLSGPQTYLSQDDKEIIESELRAAVDEAVRQALKYPAVTLDYLKCSDDSKLMKDFENCLGGLGERVNKDIAKATNEALEKAAQVIDGWHIKKGGYGILAEAVRALKAGGKDSK